VRAAFVLALAAAVAGAVAAVAGAAATPQRGFAFGRFGGNIRPYTVTIAAGGAVTVSGPVVAAPRLTAAQLAALRHLATTERFGALPASTQCTGALPDAASTFIRVGARTVRVHGYCLARYNKLWRALTRAVRLTGQT
jgi:hypothetical protein